MDPINITMHLCNCFCNCSWSWFYCWEVICPEVMCTYVTWNYCQNFLLFISSCIANSKQRVSFPWCCFRKWAIKFGDFNCRKYKQAISEKPDKINTCYSLIIIITRKDLSDRGNAFRYIRRFGWCCLDLVQILTIGYWRILNSNVKFR